MGFARKYDREIMESEEGKRLYTYWYKTVNKNTDSPEFMTFPGFYKWAMDAGYTADAKLYRRDPDGPFNPDNCTWVTSPKNFYYKRDPDREKKWDETVNRIRLHYGMNPIHSAEVEDCG